MNNIILSLTVLGHDWYKNLLVLSYLLFITLTHAVHIGEKKSLVVNIHTRLLSYTSKIHNYELINYEKSMHNHKF